MPGYQQAIPGITRFRGEEWLEPTAPKLFGPALLPSRWIFHPHPEHACRTGQCDKVWIHQLGSLPENTRSHHFQFDKGERIISQDDDFHRQIQLMKRQQITEQHRHAAVA